MDFFYDEKPDSNPKPKSALERIKQGINDKIGGAMNTVNGAISEATKPITSSLETAGSGIANYAGMK